MAFLLCCSLAPLVARLVVLTDVARQSETHENVFQKKGFATGTHLVARIEIKLRIPLLQRNATANDAGEAPQYRGENQTTPLRQGACQRAGLDKGGAEVWFLRWKMSLF